jgi:hypothetical protein
MQMNCISRTYNLSYGQQPKGFLLAENTSSRSGEVGTDSPATVEVAPG